MPTVTRFSFISIALVVGLTFLSATGCKPKVVERSISGKVTLNGKPFTAGSIQFVDPNSGVSGVAYLDEAGSYKLVSPIPVGDYKVYIGAYRPLPPNEVDKRKMPPFPEKYKTHATSGWTFTVKEGENIADFDMK